MKRSFICCYRDKPAPQLWMQPGWHMLLDIFLHHCWQVFQQDHLGTVEGLEAALQQQITSRVSRLASIRCLLNISTLTPKPLDTIPHILPWMEILFHCLSLLSHFICSLFFDDCYHVCLCFDFMVLLPIWMMIWKVSCNAVRVYMAVTLHAACQYDCCMRTSTVQ